MPAVTPSTVKRESMGSKVLLKLSFSGINDGATWTASTTSIFGHWFQRTDDPTTQTSAGVSVNRSSGTFTFYPAEDDAAGDLYIMVNG